MARTALFAQHQPGGLFAIEDMARSTGSRFFVDSATGSDTVGYGQSPDSPTATIDYAIALCTASKGDIIYVMPGHAENVITATGINCDVAGISIIGLGENGSMPAVSFTAAAGSVTVAAANVVINNLKLIANFATGTTTGFTIEAAGDGCVLDGVVMRDTSAANEFLIHVSVAPTVADLVIRNCSFAGLAGAMSNSILFVGTSTNCVIEDTDIFVDSSDSVIDHATGASVNLRVRRNVVVNADAGTAGYCVENKSDGTGVCHNNLLGYNKVDAEVTAGDATWFFENYASNTIAESGLLDPATSHAIP